MVKNADFAFFVGAIVVFPGEVLPGWKNFVPFRKKEDSYG
jgi:hypothetical protein